MDIKSVPADLVVPNITASFCPPAPGHRVLAALPGWPSGAGSGAAASTSGVGTSASINRPTALALHEGKQMLFVADYFGNRIRYVYLPTLAVGLLAGSGVGAWADGVGSAAAFFQPYGLVVDPGGAILYVGDSYNNRIRKITISTSNVTTLAGSGAQTPLINAVGAAANLSPAGMGLDAATGEYVDMIAMGIIDPAKVTRSALQNAASIAGLFLTTEAVVAEKPEKSAPAMPGGDGGMGGMDF